MTKPSTRLITLILLLQRQPNQKASDLAEKLGVSVRTLHRYFQQLDEMGIPIYTERGPHGGFSLVRGYKMPPLILTPEEATAVYLGANLVEEIWGSLYKEAVQGTLAKLDNLLPDEQRHEAAWARRSMVTSGMQRIDASQVTPCLEKLRRAVRELRTVHMLYCSSGHSEIQARDLDPYTLIYRWGWWYVIGHCHLRGEIRLFRLDRIEDMALTGVKFEIPEEFDIHNFLDKEFQSQSKIQVCMSFDPQSAFIAQANRSYWDTMEIKYDGSVMVTFTAPDLGWAASSVLAYGPTVSVIEPQELRQMVLEQARSIIELYQSNYF